ncbi:MAG: hypothetical protein ACTMHG_01145 [Marinobacter sp.]
MTTMTADTRSDREGPGPDQVRRGRRTALLLFTVGFGPMILATLMYYTGWLNPAEHTNEGTLVQPVVPVQQLNLETATGEPFSARFSADQADPQWHMLVASENCGGDCERLLYLSRQVNIALGKNAPRVSRSAWLGSLPADLESRWQEEYRLMERLQQSAGSRPAWPEGFDPGEQPGILLVDPFGNVMMRYGPEHTGKQLLKDLKHLLKLSQVG